MSSFRKKQSVHATLKILSITTSAQTGQFMTTFGNPALDELLGGGIPLNSIVLIEEDKHCIYTKVLNKIFLAEGMVTSQDVFLGCLDDSPKEIMKKLPTVVYTYDSDSDPDQWTMDTESLRIAWRYNDLPYVHGDKSYKENHHFNLQEYMEYERTFALNALWDGNKIINNTAKHLEKNPLDHEENEKETLEESESEKNTICFSNTLFQSLAEDLLKVKTQFVRICIQSLGSPLWYDENFGEDLLKFLTVLRSVVQNTKCVCLITMPMHLIAKKDETLVPKIRNLVDFSIELESFAVSDRIMNPAFKDYHGLVHFRKMSAINSIALFQHSDLAFKLRRKKFVIEKFHLPPELGETTENDLEKVSSKPVVSCSKLSSPEFF